MDGKLPQKSNFLTPQRQPYFPPRPYHSTLNLDLLDSMFQKLQMSSKVFKSNKIEDKVQLQNTFQPKVIKFNSGQELFMGLRVNRPLPISQNLNSSPKQKQQNQSPPKPTAKNSNTTTIKIPKMNIFKTIPITEAISPPVEDKKKLIGNKREREVGSTIVNFNVTNIYAPSNITIQSGKEEKKKIEKETQLLEDIKKILLELEHGYHTDNKKNEVYISFDCEGKNYNIKKVKENVKGITVTNDKGDIINFTTKKDIIAELTKLKQNLLHNK